MNKKIKRLVLKHLNRIYSQSVKMSLTFNMSAISPVLLEDIIKLNKLEKTKDNKELHDFIGKYNTMLDNLLANCLEYMKRIGAEKISFQYLRVSINTLKSEIFKL